MAGAATTVVATAVVTVTATPTAHKATGSESILDGYDPSEYMPSNPIMLFIIQAMIILLVCRAMHFPLGYLRQPRVVGEVLGGIILGPSVIGRIPGFSNTVFPKESIPVLSNVANLGLILFLFIIGLEVDMRVFFGNWKIAISVAAAGMTFPFALGAAVAHGLYHQFSSEPGTVPIAYGTFLLFIGVAMSITAFPVLCRILTELKLLGTPVGIITLASGVGDDVVGWVLLALCVALVNAATGLTALYIILVTLGYALFLFFAVRPCFMWVLKRTHSLQDGPTQGVMVLTMLMMLGSAFFTGAAGVHPIFGAFLAGLICPHEGGFAIKVTEKIEDLMSALFLPLYFTLSGLNTNLGLLNNGITWAYLIAVTIIAFTAKFIGCACAARVNGLVWRESFSIGSLMACKGLVELIVLNIGLQAKILSTRVFTVFVVMALITTFVTTPLASALYPPWYQKKLDAWKRGEIDWETGKSLKDGNSSADDIELRRQRRGPGDIRNLLIYLRLDNMPNTLAFVSLFGGQTGEFKTKLHPQHEDKETLRLSEEQTRPVVQVHGVRIVQLTMRSASIMTAAEVGELSAFDPVLNAFRVLGQLYNLAVSGEVAVIPEDAYAETLTGRAHDEQSDLLLLPWTETGSLSESPMVSKNTIEQKLRSDAYIAFVKEALDTAVCTTAVFVNRAFSGSLEQSPLALTRRMIAKGASKGKRGQVTEVPVSDRSHHVVVLFFGGPDGQAAAALAMQLAENPTVTVTMVHYQVRVEGKASQDPIVQEGGLYTNEGKVRASTSMPSDDDYFVAMQHTLPEALRRRVTFRTVISYDPVEDAVKDAQNEVGQQGNGGDLILVGRHVEIVESQATCLGLVADVLLEKDTKASIVVVQARRD